MKNILILLLSFFTFTQCNIAQKTVALTFDDGPDLSYTEKLLDILKEEGVKATFFVIGDKVRKYPQITKRIAREGHLIGNHSTSHVHFSEYRDTASVLEDVSYVDSLVYALTGNKITYFRPPYGDLRSEQKALLQRHGYKIALWTLSARDWDVFHVSKQNIIDTIKTYLHDNAVILLHSKNSFGSIKDYPYRDNTVEALPEVIKYIKDKGYKFVTLDKIKPESKIGGDSKSVEYKLKNRDDIVFYGGFEEWFGNLFWSQNWGVPWDRRIDKCKIIPSDIAGKRALRVSYPKGGLGPSTTGASFPIVLRDIPAIKEKYLQEAYLRYYVKFEKGFDFRKGGKLPGLMGGGDSWDRSGGNQPNGDNGWTMRFMWVDSGKIVVYAYVPKSKNGKWGGHQWGQGINCDFYAEPGKWICIEQYINVGTPGKDDGKLKVWIDGVEKVNIDDMRFWDIENDFGRIGGIYFSSFHGGNTEDWSPQNNSYIQFDGFVIGKKRVGKIEK